MLRIETAGLHDLPGAYRTCLLTGDSGSDATGQIADPDLLGHVYVGPYLMQRSGTQLVVQDAAGSAGYLLSTDDTLAFERWAEAEWWPALRARYPLDTEAAGMDAELIEHIHHPPRTDPLIAADYPAHLHIDLQARAQGQGLGRRLIERLLSDLRARGVAGVHLGVDLANQNSIGFYRHLGFADVAPTAWGLIMGMKLDR